MSWRGTAAVHFPWGSLNHTEQLVYHIDDANPAVAAVEGEGESIETLADRVLTYRGHLSFRSDAGDFYYEFTWRTTARRSFDSQQDLARHHTARFTVARH